MSESTEVQLARLQEQMKQVLEELRSAKDSRKQQYEHNEAMNKLLLSLDGRVGNVEGTLAVQSPTIEEFITIKHKVVGAGLLGKWVWLLLGGTVSWLYTSRETILAWFSK